MKKTVFIPLVLLIGLLGACNTSKKVDMDKIDKSYTVALGENVVLELESNPSTGYVWEMKEISNKGNVELVSKEFKASNSNKNFVGEGGVDQWTFKGNKKGKVILNFRYKRPNEDKDEKIYFYEIIVN